MTFLEKIKPHLISDDILIQETVLHALHDYPLFPEEWTVELLKEAFRNKEKQSYILIYVDHQTINEEAVKVLIENIPSMDKSKVHLAINLLLKIEPELALTYRESLEKYIPKDMWAIYELTANGTEEEVYMEYGGILSDLDHANPYQNDLYIKGKILAACIVKNGWVTEQEIDIIIREELEEQWFSYHGILTIYMIGLLKIEKYIPMLASMLGRDEDVLLEEVSAALIQFQSDDVVKEVAPYLYREDSVIFAASVVENIKTDFAIQVLREAYAAAEEIGDQDILIESICHHFSREALPEISRHMKNEYTSNIVDIEQTVYSYYSILGEHHPELEFWRKAALEREMDFRNDGREGTLGKPAPVRIETKVGRNDPCPCGSGKKYKKCCGK
ncbi:YecA family protein [Neobacillus sp. SAB-20_R2A]|uniref:YecA family protein n=1 Tax=Neobacillus sp. SAB-20_R2A TaxID=3120519 RepID=UPI003C6DFC3F